MQTVLMCDPPYILGHPSHTNPCALPQAQLDTYTTINYHWVEIQQNDAFSKTVKLGGNQGVRMI